jgi:hypothetical protein
MIWIALFMTKFQMKPNRSLPTLLFAAVSLGLTTAVMAAPTPTPTATPMSSPAAFSPYNGFLLGTKIVGSHIDNMQNQDIGTINDLVVNPDTGRVRFAVLDVGGFLGIDSVKVVVPWGAVGLKKNKPGDAPSYVIDATKDRLEKAPKFDASKLSDLYTTATAQPIFDYYSITFFEDVPTPTPTPATSPSPSPKK